MLYGRLMLILLLSAAVPSAPARNASKAKTVWSIHNVRYMRQPKPQRDWTMYRLIILPAHRMLFCYIEKVACTSFNSLFNHIANQTVNRLKNMWLLNDWRRHRLRISDLIGYLRNESWHKAVFYRDPVDRFVSAYLSKCVPNKGYSKKGSRHCDDTFGNHSVTFGHAVEVIGQVDAVGNAHWLQQHQFCGGLKKYLSVYDTVELLEPESVNSKVKDMLGRANIPQTRDLNAAVDQYFPQLPFESGHSDWRRGSFTNASAKARELFPDSAIGAERLATVVRHYIEDYRIFNMTITLWQLQLLRSEGRRFEDVLQMLPYLPQFR